MSQLTFNDIANSMAADFPKIGKSRKRGGISYAAARAKADYAVALAKIAYVVLERNKSENDKMGFDLLEISEIVSRVRKPVLITVKGEVVGETPARKAPTKRITQRSRKKAS